MIGDLCTLLRNQTFSVTVEDPASEAETVYQVTKVYARHADEDAVIPYLVVNRTGGGDRCETLDGNDDSLLFTDVSIEVHSNQPAIDVPLAESIAEFLETSINIPMGTRTLFGCVVEPLEDFDNPPPDGSDEWKGGSKITAHLSHS